MPCSAHTSREKALTVFCQCSPYFTSNSSCCGSSLYLLSGNQTWLVPTGNWPGIAKDRIRRPVQPHSYFPVKGWTCSWHDLIIPRWLKQMSRPSRSLGTYSRRNRKQRYLLFREHKKLENGKSVDGTPRHGLENLENPSTLKCIL